MLEKVIELCREYYEGSEEITGEKKLMEELEISSLDFMMLIGDVEEAFGLVISEDELMEIRTLNDIVQIVEAHS